jgi:hypothetical protein
MRRDPRAAVPTPKTEAPRHPGAVATTGPERARHGGEKRAGCHERPLDGGARARGKKAPTRMQEKPPTAVVLVGDAPESKHTGGAGARLLGTTADRRRCEGASRAKRPRRRRPKNPHRRGASQAARGAAAEEAGPDEAGPACGRAHPKDGGTEAPRGRRYHWTRARAPRRRKARRLPRTPARQGSARARKESAHADARETTNRRSARWRCTREEAHRRRRSPTPGNHRG